MSDDLIGRYLADLNRRLRVSKERKREILAEAEDHLRESAAAGVSIGMTDTEAQEAAISAFGPVKAVVRAHRARRADLAADLILVAWKMAWTGMFAIAASGFVALAMNHLFGRAFVGQAPAGASYPAAACQHWLAIWHGARTCAQAAMLENSSDAVSLRVIGGGLAGVVLLAGYLAAHRIRRHAGGPARLTRSALPPALFPVAAVAVFGLGALGLAVVALTGSPVGVPSGPGAYLSGSLVALIVAAACAPRAFRAFRSPG